MDFSKALEAMKDEKKIRRANMQSNTYICYMRCLESKFVSVKLSDKYLNVPTIYQFTHDDLLAEDWEIV
jgi:hypothetical protein